MLNQKSNHQSKLHYALVSESGQRLQFFETTKGAGFDLNLFSIEDMQHVLISRIQCLQAGFPANHFIITTLDEIRNQFVEQFGVGAYFNQMRRVISKTNRQNSERPAKHEATVPAYSPQKRSARPTSVFQYKNFDFSDTEAVQQRLKVRAYCRKMDIVINQAEVVALDRARANYIASIGIQTYLNQMLGALAETPTEDCVVLRLGRRQYFVELQAEGRLSIFNGLERYFRQGWPYLRVEVHPKRDAGVQVCYL